MKIQEYLWYGGRTLLQANKSSAIFLRYEDVSSNHKSIIKRLLLAAQSSAPEEVINEILQKVSLKSVKKRMKTVGLRSFSDIDEKTDLHGRHVSSLNGGKTDWRVFHQISQIN